MSRTNLPNYQKDILLEIVGRLSPVTINDWAAVCKEYQVITNESQLRQANNCKRFYVEKCCVKNKRHRDEDLLDISKDSHVKKSRDNFLINEVNENLNENSSFKNLIINYDKTISPNKDILIDINTDKYQKNGDVFHLANDIQN